jgi:cyclase
VTIGAPAKDPLRKACEEVADNVFVYMSGKLGPNAVFVVGAESILLFDTLMTPIMAEELHRAIRHVSAKPIAVVVYSHYHGDHVLGGERFAPPAVTVAHENTRRFLDQIGMDFVPVYASWRRTAEDAAAVRQVRRIVPPAVTFRDALTLYVDEVRVELQHLGPGHSPSDVIAVLPDKEVLATGDLLIWQSVSGVRDARTAGWIQRMDELYALAPRIIVPGHGQWTEEKWIIAEARDFMAHVWEACQQGHAAGRAVEDVLRTLDVSAWSHFHGLKRLHEVVIRNYEELDGRPSKYELAACHQLVADD